MQESAKEFFVERKLARSAGAQVIPRDSKAGTDRREVCGSENYETAFLLLVRHAPKLLGFDLTVRAVVFARAFAFPFGPCL